MRLFLSLILLLFFFAASAQHPKVVKARSLVEAGKTTKAFALLQKAYKKSKDKEIARELIRQYANDEAIIDAMEWAHKISLANSVELDDAVLYTDLLIQQGKYKKALDKCIDYALHFENAQPLYERAYTCENLLQAKMNSILYTIEEVPFNAHTDEISITNYRRNFVMASNRTSEMAEGTSNQNYFNFYFLQKDFNRWRYPTYVLRDNDNEQNKTTLCYSVDGNRVYYTLSERQPTKAKKKGPVFQPSFRIRQAISMGNEWLHIEELPFQKPGANYKDPAIHPEGLLLVYASDQDGEGGYDLFFSEWKDEQWTPPSNLGTQVNSEADETMPYFDELGKLYFSSDRKLGFGGFDIYETIKDNGMWLKPKILPPPLNSAFDDLSLIKHYSRPGGYLASNRPGGKGGFDIYEFTEIDFRLGVTVLDNSNGNLVELAEVQLFRNGVFLDHRLTNQAGIAEFQIGKNTGYDIKVVKEGYVVAESNVHSRVATEGKLLYWNIKLKPDPKLKPAIEADPEAHQNFITFTAEIIDNQNEPIANLPIRLINTNSMKVKLVTTDNQGKFSQSLLLGNNYEFVMEYEGERFVGVFSTIGLTDMDPKQARYTLGKN